MLREWSRTTSPIVPAPLLTSCRLLVSPTDRQGWSTAPADWFESEPAAGGTRAAFLELYRLASPEQITEVLEGIWLMLDRAALWVLNIHVDFAADTNGIIDQTCAALLPAIPRRMYTLTCLGRGLDHLPTAMAAARAAFEAGLRLAWINAPQEPQERAIRVLLIHMSQAKWKRKVSADYDLTTTDGGDRRRVRIGFQAVRPPPPRRMRFVRVRARIGEPVPGRPTAQVPALLQGLRGHRGPHPDPGPGDLRLDDSPSATRVCS
jgi:hypothetical protein